MTKKLSSVLPIMMLSIEQTSRHEDSVRETNKMRKKEKSNNVIFHDFYCDKKKQSTATNTGTFPQVVHN